MTPDSEQRRAEDLFSNLWPEIENRLRRIMDESIEKLELRIYERSFDPLKDRVDAQDKFCAAHTQELTKTQTLLEELTEAKLIRRMEVAEARIGLIGKSTVVIGTIAGSAMVSVLIAVLTHQLRL